MPEKRLPVTVRYVSDKTTKGRAGIRWDNVVEKTWKDLGDQEVLTIEVWRVQDRSRVNDSKKGKASAKK